MKITKITIKQAKKELVDNIEKCNVLVLSILYYHGFDHVRDCYPDEDDPNYLCCKKERRSTYYIRRCGFEAVYLDKNGNWGEYKDRKKFKDYDKAEKFVHKISTIMAFSKEQP